MPLPDNVVVFDGITTLDLQAERVLSKAIEASLKTAVVVGWTETGEFYFASTASDGGECMWLFEQAKQQLLDVAKDLSK